MIENNIPMRTAMRQMEPGQEMEISLRYKGYASIRNCASLLGLDLGRKYSVTLKREARMCKVTRVR